MVRTRGLEPPHPKAYEPESYVYTNFTTCALSLNYNVHQGVFTIIYLKLIYQ